VLRGAAHIGLTLRDGVVDSLIAGVARLVFSLFELFLGFDRVRLHKIKEVFHARIVPETRRVIAPEFDRRPGVPVIW